MQRHFPDGATISEVGRRSTNLFFLARRSQYAVSLPNDEIHEDATGVSEPDILIVPRSLFNPGAVVPARAASLISRYQQACVIEAQDLSATGAVYDWQDEFYLPLKGFGHIWRPGPNLTIYVRPDLARTALSRLPPPSAATGLAVCSPGLS